MSRMSDIERCDFAANYSDLLRAIIIVHDELKEDGEKPGSDKWISHSKYRCQLFRMVVSQWCQITELGDEYFPWNEDYICRIYPSYRKSSEGAKGELRRELFRHGDSLEAVDPDEGADC